MKVLYLLALFPILLSAQQLQPVTSVQADCGKFSSPIRVAGTFTTAIVDNRQAGCDGWVVTYSSNGFATVSVLLQSAPLGAGGVAGAFVNFAGTIVAPTVNPATATTQGEIRATGYYPYVRVQITTTGAGYLQAEFHGFKTDPNSGSGAPSSSGGCVGTSVTPCVVDGPDAQGTAPTKPPVLIAGVFGNTAVKILSLDAGGGILLGTTPDPGDGVGDFNFGILQSTAGGNVFDATISYFFNGSTWDRGFVCSNQARVTLTDGTRTQLVALSATKVVRVCQIHMTTTAPEDFTISYGTGSACGTGTTTIDKYLSVVAFSTDFQPTAALRTIASNALCVTQSGTQSAEVTVVYAQF
jgi:hypothetical protein